MHTCKINDFEIQYPEKWDELTRHQLITIVRGFSLGLSDLEFRVKTSLSFLNFKVAKQKPTYRSPDVLHLVKPSNGKPVWISNTQITAIANTVGFLTVKHKTKEGIELDILNSSLTINLIPTFRHRLRLYHGPKEKLFSLVFEEYLEADNHFLAYTNGNDPSDLDKLVATLYRTGKNKVFNSEMVDAHSKKLHNLNSEIKLSVLLFYQGCRKFLAANFPHVFSSSGGASKNNYGPLGLIDALTGDDVTKNKAVRSSFLFDVMVRLERAAVQKEEMERELEKLKKK